MRSKTLTFVISSLFLLLWPAISQAENAQSQTSNKYADITNRFSIGSDEAPVTIDLFYAPTCPHCRRFFNDHLKILQEEYVDTQKLKIIFHDISLNPATHIISYLLHCQNHGYKFEIAKIILNSQTKWIYAQKPIEEIKRIFKLAGYSDQLIESCLNDRDLQTHLSYIFFKETEKYNIQAVPKLYINDEEFEDIFDIEALQNKLDSLL